MKDLTKGPVFKTLILFAIPIFFGNLFQLFYSLADTRIVGTYLGEEALAAVGGTGVLSNLLIGFMNGMTLGFAVPMARFYGGKKFERLKKAFASAVGVGLILCVILVSVCLFCMDSLMVFMKMEPQLLTDARSYCTVLICGLFFTFAYNLGAATLRAL
ncbi:MAG: MATE family efflux transporter, partial [Lachnospiraceae bacterium]|nr:MATE family efflux transporter [Lachnospiraceae bacterium]